MAAIESETVKSRCGDGHGFDFDLLKLPRRPDENAIEKFKGKPKFGGGGGSYKPKPKWFYSDWWLLEEISDGDSESDDEGEDLVFQFFFSFFPLSSIFNMLHFKFVEFLSKFQYHYYYC